jgi:hypothetical protein
VAPDRSGLRRRSTLTAIGGALSIVAVYLWDDALFAAPIIAATSWLGAVPAFLILSVVYSLASLVLALLAVRVYDRRTGNEPSRFARWLEHQGESRRSSWVKRLLLSGKIVGFVLSSFLIGGIVTTFLIRYSGRTDRITTLAVLSSVIFGVTFVGFYSGIGRIVFGH